MPLFADLDRLKAELDALRPLAPEQEQRVLQKFRLDWNYHSNAIEGNSLTLGETRSLLLHGIAASGKSMRDHDDIRNHNKTVAEVELLAAETRPLTEHLIREMHEILLGRESYYVEARTAEGMHTRQLIQPGTYKKNQNQALTATGEQIFFASPEETPARMTDLLDWYRQEETTHTLHPVALAVEFHHRFVSIHPFDDGNGRISRLLMNLILMRHGYPITVIKADETNRNRYLAALSEADAGEPEPFLRFIIENVEASLRLMIRAAKGESIDEPSDLDKKLALLKKQVASKEDFTQATWNSETQRRFFKEMLEPCIIHAWHTLGKLNELFFQTSIAIETRDINNRHLSEEKNVHLTQLIHEVANALQHEILLGEIRLSFIWSDFKSTTNSFNQYARLEWKFERFSCKTLFTLNPGAYNYQAETNYRQSNNLALANESITKLATSAVDFIAAKIAEANTPSA